MFWQFLLTAIADEVLLIKNKTRTLKNRRERVTMVAVNPKAFQTFQTKLAEFTQLKRAMLPAGEPKPELGNTEQ